MLSLVSYTLGILSIIYGAAMLVPLGFEFAESGVDTAAFLIASILALFLGGLLFFVSNNDQKSMTAAQAFLLTTISWFWMALLCALPLYISTLDLTLTDAFFEAMSGLTTTGATVLTDLENTSRGVLVWRSISQWFGGFGIIAFAIILLPVLRVGGMHLFHAESSDRSSKSIPLTAHYIYSLMSAYVFLTFLCYITYSLLGMNPFDAFNHSLTTVSTGGFSTHDTSFAFFDSQALMFASTIFMLSGAIPFVLYTNLIFQKKLNFLRDEQVVAFLKIILLTTFFLLIGEIFTGEQSFFNEVIPALFNVVSVITTTGYVSEDYQLWGGFAVGIFFFLTYLGSCAGSTSGGLKIFRIVILMRVIKHQLQKLIYPNGVFATEYNGKAVKTETILSIVGFFFIYLFTNLVLAMLLSTTGVDFITAVSGSATAIANVGPGLGEVIGPVGNFSTLSDTAKWYLSVGMLAGRLEILTMLVLFIPALWKS
ncbi:MAG: potassium transporter TrkH [Alphaproteobacteria bacterium]|nr:potassium transporter TrkH [Alphaproteobacteria bacterium]